MPTSTQHAGKQTEPLDRAWQEWLETNIQRGCTAESLIQAMVAQRIDAALARAHVTRTLANLRGVEARQAPANTIASPTVSEAVVAADTPYQTEPSRLGTANVLRAGGRRMRVLLRVERPEIVLLENVLSSGECEELMELSREKLERSTTVDPATGQRMVIEARTSQGTFFGLRENPLVASIDERLAELLSWPVEKSEGLQILRYQQGAEYRPHYDYFPTSDAGSQVHLASGGQRVGTLILYLNDVREGGETIFPEISLSVAPRRGYAVYFGYHNSFGQVDPLTLHGGAPVRQGEKWIATKWLREHVRA